MGTRSYIAAAVLLAVGAPLYAQSFYGTVVGTVNDSTGAAVPQANVSLINAGTSERRTAQSDDQGNYRFVNLIPGTYRVEVEHTGFRRHAVDNVIVAVDATLRVDVALQVGEVTQTMEVSSQAPLLQTETGSLSQVVSARAVQELPLNGRNVLNLVALSPGVVPQGSAEGSLTGKNVFAGGNYQIGGGMANQSAAYFDGVPVNDSYGNIVALIPSQDVVSEFRVQTNANSAEFGRYTGGVINLTSKSGTNEFHGSAYEFLRNKVLNAGAFFSNRTGAAKAPFVQNQYGLSIGGPVKRDKLFFFGAFEGFRQRQGTPFLRTVPTEAMSQGDFSNYRNAAGAVVPIYDPLTQCGALGNAACGTDVVQRAPFAGNRIPASRINAVAAKFVAFPVFAKPNTPADAAGNFNFFRNASTGGDNDQGNFRADYNVSEKQRILARYSRWKSVNLPVDVYGNKQRNGDPFSPEAFITDHAVLADTYSLNPTTILDVRVGFMRWFYDRTPGNLGINIAQTFGLPSYFNDIPAKNGVTPSTIVPQIGAAGYDYITTGLLAARDNTYILTPTLTKIVKSHTLKFGAEWRRAENNYYQNNQPGGQFNFDNLFTSRNALNSGGTGNSFASMLLGLVSSGSVSTSPFTAAFQRYQAYFVNDSWQVNTKLTVNLGLRWEIPGQFTERFDRQVTFNRDLANPELNGISVPGRSGPINGTFVLVNGPSHPERGLRPEHYKLFAPRASIAYRLSDRTVIRTGAGIYYIPANVIFFEGPYGNPVNFLAHNMVNSLDGQVTPADTLSNPFPSGFNPPPGRDPSFQRLLLGGTGRAITRDTPYGYTGQWNFTVQHQLPGNLAVEAAYAALKGVHLAWGGRQNNQIAPEYMSLGSQLTQQVPNPFASKVLLGPLTRSTVARGQLLLPFPHLVSAPDAGAYTGNSSYHSLQMKAEKRFGGGGTVLATYTFSKVISDTETITTWLDGVLGGVAGVQNWYDLRNEKALSSYDSRRRFTLAYVNDLPFGKGKMFLSGAGGFADKVISGWGVNGTVTLQDGFPLLFTAAPNVTGFNTGLRPNVVPGCDPKLDGAAQQRLTKWFNTSCFTVPAGYTFGNAGRTDPLLRGHGINNFNFALFKRTAITERFKLEFRAEAFNAFNRVQFGRPNQGATTAANNTFGVVSTQINDPRLIQFGLRLFY
ncbi:MAG: carboxypeptidase regulatory-like domain-containing protein [Bryobacteraceae bacterium]